MCAVPNPKFLPQAALLDDLFGLVVLSLQRYREISRATPKSPDLTLAHASDLWVELRAFYEAYFAAPQDRAAMLHHAELIGRYATQILMWVDASAASPALKQYLTEVLEDALTGADKALKRKKRAPPDPRGPERAAANRALAKLTALDVLCADSDARLFSGAMNELLESVEVGDPRAMGWSLVQSAAATYAGQLTSEYVMEPGAAQARYGLPIRLTLRVQPMERSMVRQGYCAWQQGSDDVRIGISALPEHPMGRAEHVTAEWILSILLHECVHLMQAVEELARGREYTGIGVRVGERFHQHDLKGEAQLKREFAGIGLDPRYVNYHTLDDIEFYALLLEEVLLFLHLLPGETDPVDAERRCFKDIVDAVEAFTRERAFFEILREMQPRKYRLAIIELETTAALQREEIERLYLCKFRDPYLISSMRRGMR